MLTETTLEGPLSLDISETGRAAVLDREGRRLSLVRAGDAPVEIEIAFTARACRFRGDDVVVLGAGRLLSLAADGSAIGEMPVRSDATCLAVLKSGSVLVGYGVAEHGVIVERFGPAPLAHAGSVGATCLAVESGSFWVGGVASVARLRPAASGLDQLRAVDLPAPSRAAAIGPDGAVYLLLDPGDRLVRILGDSIAITDLGRPLRDLARGRQSLWGVGDRGVVDLTAHVPPPGSPAPPSRTSPLLVTQVWLAIFLVAMGAWLGALVVGIVVIRRAMARGRDRAWPFVMRAAPAVDLVGTWAALIASIALIVGRLGFGAAWATALGFVALMATAALYDRAVLVPSLDAAFKRLAGGDDPKWLSDWRFLWRMSAWGRWLTLLLGVVATACGLLA